MLEIATAVNTRFLISGAQFGGVTNPKVGTGESGILARGKWSQAFIPPLPLWGQGTTGNTI